MVLTLEEIKRRYNAGISSQVVTNDELNELIVAYKGDPDTYRENIDYLSLFAGLTPDQEFNLREAK